MSEREKDKRELKRKWKTLSKEELARELLLYFKKHHSPNNINNPNEPLKNFGDQPSDHTYDDIMADPTIVFDGSLGL